MTFYAQDLIEKTTTLNLYKAEKRVIYSVLIPALNSGDIVHITSTFEVTNPYTYNAMIGSQIILANAPNEVTGTMIDPANSFNVTPDGHHGVVNKARTWKSPSSYINKYINVVAWSASVNALPGHLLIVEQQYGHLDVFIV